MRAVAAHFSVQTGDYRWYYGYIQACGRVCA